MKNPPRGSRLDRFYRILELFFAAFGGLAAILVAIAFTVNQLSFSSSRLVDIIPLPLLYLIEVALLGAVGFLAVWANRGPRPTSPWQLRLPWLVAGALIVFVVLGALSIGAFLIPAMVGMLAAGLFGDLRQDGSLLNHAGLFLLAAVAQTAVMFLFLLLGA